MNQALRFIPLFALASLGFGCSGESKTQGFGQPLRVLDAQFRGEELPGSPPLTADDLNAGVMPKVPAVTAISLANGLIPVGEPSRSISGRASLGAAAVGVKLADSGSGYWLVPTGSADVVNNGEVEWRLNAAFAQDAQPGLHSLLFAALDEQGNSGTQGELKICLAPEIPDNGNSCDPKTAPPAVVVSLDWDSPVDLDLRVITPSGKVVDSKHPTTALEDEKGKIDPNQEGSGLIDRDAVASCKPDGRRRENLVFQSSPSPGTYLIYANLYDSCGEAGVRFNVSLHVSAAGADPDTFAVEETYRQSGELAAAAENGGAQLGMFITTFVAH